ncbi:PIN domain-containing protein [Desulfonema limicola]|uniref:PIN domain-containing protein n=1 Tax=Desulfonema limicola TaxID=45656 RepID=A0A975BE72_9BACT|nr:PIN domain-containing protein [Desulfonema limicola]QTA83470.1 PIN domain-containing protein [Desulfonema limicola]
MRYFLDTSYLIAITHKRDQYHEHAVKISRSLEKPVRLVTTEAILMEYGNMLSQKHIREKAFNYIQILRNSTDTEIIPISQELFEKGLSSFGKYKDKEWGLVDCISFEVMKEKKILYALTSDEHFEQAGFVMLLKF